MSLWLERLNELDRNETYRLEAEQHQLIRQEQAGPKKAQTILPWIIHWLGSACLQFAFEIIDRGGLSAQYSEKE